MPNTRCMKAHKLCAQTPNGAKNHVYDKNNYLFSKRFPGAAVNKTTPRPSMHVTVDGSHGRGPTLIFCPGAPEFPVTPLCKIYLYYYCLLLIFTKFLQVYLECGSYEYIPKALYIPPLPGDTLSCILLYLACPRINRQLISSQFFHFKSFC